MVIIGVIAAITVPSLMNRTNNQETVSKLKKAYSTLAQAYDRARFENPNVESWTTYESNTCESSKDWAEHLKPYLSTMTNLTCSYDRYSRFKVATKTLDGNYYETIGANKYYVFDLQDGITILVYTVLQDNQYVRFAVATQGEKTFKNPIIGKNLFYFYADKTSVKPFNISSCTKSRSGLGCSAFILTYGNMDYPN